MPCYCRYLFVYLYNSVSTQALFFLYTLQHQAAGLRFIHSRGWPSKSLFEGRKTDVSVWTESQNRERNMWLQIYQAVMSHALYKYIINNSLSLFPRHFVALCCYTYAVFSTSAVEKLRVSLLCLHTSGNHGQRHYAFRFVRLSEHISRNSLRKFLQNWQ